MDGIQNTNTTISTLWRKNSSSFTSFNKRKTGTVRLLLWVCGGTGTANRKSGSGTLSRSISLVRACCMLLSEHIQKSYFYSVVLTHGKSMLQYFFSLSVPDVRDSESFVTENSVTYVRTLKKHPD